VHLVVREGISDIQELTGKVVDIGAVGSGTDITASVILSGLDIPVRTSHLGTHHALEGLRRGEIDAAFFVGGKPMPLLQDIEQDSGLALLPIPFVQYASSYRPASISRRDYPNLVTAAREGLSTIAVRTGLFTYAWRPDSPRYQALASFSEALFNHLDELHQDGNHAKWREVDPTSRVFGWQRFEPARIWVEAHVEQARNIALAGQKLIGQSLLAEPDGPDPERSAPPSSLGAALAPKVPLPPGQGPSLPRSGEEGEPQSENPSFDDRSVSEPPAAAPAIESLPSSDGGIQSSGGTGGPMERRPGNAIGALGGGGRAQVANDIGPSPRAPANMPTF
jgi:hypothetical protein